VAAEGKRILLGRIAAAHGIRGEVLIHAFTERPEDIAAYGPLDDGSGRSFRLKVVRVTPKGGVVAAVAGVSDRNAAETLKGTQLYIDRNRLPPPDEGQFYHADLIGLAAVDAAGRPVGEVVAVHNHGAGDLLEVRLPDAAKTELIAFTDTFVPEVDLVGRRVVVRLGGAEAAAEESATKHEPISRGKRPEP
jgi:16S rRNA processing protein RimM